MQIILETYGVVLAFLVIGIGVFVVAAGVIAAAGNHEDRYQNLQSEISEAQHARRREHQKILMQIGAPECPDGTYSPRQVALWDRYNQLNTIDKKLTRQEQNGLVNARGYLTDEYADIVEGER